MKKPLVIAHRGDSSEALENSLGAIRRALSYSVDMIELDVRKSTDNVLYVMHDKMTGRTAEKNINIEHVPSDVINGVRLKNGEPIPTVDEVLRTVASSAGINFEIKSDGAGAMLAKHLASTSYPGSVLVSSFKEQEVRGAARVLPSLPVSLIYDVFSVHEVSAYRDRGCRIISLRKNTVNEKLIAVCHDRGIAVYVWTVDEEEEMRKFTSWGVDGIYSNRPAVLKNLIERGDSASRETS
jgi:glycerophosphoryl diester phosphodiesterase